MTTLYIIISLLWGILVALYCLRSNYKIFATVLISILSIVTWPIYIVIAIVIEAIHLVKSKKKNDEEEDTVVKSIDELKSIIFENKDEE